MLKTSLGASSVSLDLMGSVAATLNEKGWMAINKMSSQNQKLFNMNIPYVMIGRNFFVKVKNFQIK